MTSVRKKPKNRCPRCRSTRMERRLDGSRFCARCGQRIASDGRLIPSADRRGEGVLEDGAQEDGQMVLL